MNQKHWVLKLLGSEMLSDWI